MAALLNIPRSVLYHMKTAFLFTKSDIKTTVIPISVLATAASPRVSLSLLPHTVFWVWFHCLQFDVSNQTLDPDEDMHNKRDRPLPAGRITKPQADVLRWLLVPACLALSAFYSREVVLASAALCLLTWIYNERHAHAGHWIVRNLVNALGFAAFETGSSLIAGGNFHTMTPVAFMSVIASAGIFFTTIQAQDFKDTEGDKLIGRKTLPIVAPYLARPTLLIALMAWSMGLSFLWRTSTLVSLLFNVLALAVGGRYVALKSIREDQVSFYLYNVWLSMAHILPAFSRISAM